MCGVSTSSNSNRCLTSAAFCSSALGIAKSSTIASSAKAIDGDIVEIAAIDASDVLRKADLSHGDDVSI